MGCSESKADSGASSGNKPDQQQQDAGDGNQQARPSAGSEPDVNPPESKSPDPEPEPEPKPEESQQQSQEDDDVHMYITTEEAVQYIVKELGVSEERASKMVDKFNKNNDNQVANEELTALCKTVRERKAEIRQKFQEVDTDGNGYVTADEANVLVAQLMNGVPESTVNAIVLRFDTEADGKIKYEAFAEFYAHIAAMKDNLAERYNLLDEDGDGKLDTDELRETIIYTTGIDAMYANCIIEDFDKNSDGKFSKAEFNEMWMKLVGSA